MSFSNEVRNELAHIIPEKDCCQKAELAAFLSLRAEISSNEDDSVHLITVVENAPAARKIYKLLKKVYDLPSSVRVGTHKRFKKNRYYVVDTRLGKKDLWILQDMGLVDENLQIKRKLSSSLISKSCCKRAYLRAVFVSKGFINRPEGNYHLELVLNDSQQAISVQKILSRLGVEARLSERKSNIIVYIKESEKIVDFLRIVGASKALLDFENVRIIKSMRNQVNRQVNCETANLAKTIDASVRQIELIKKLITKIGINRIPSQYKELAMLRIDYPDSTLKELGSMMNPPLTKSGVAYRMRKLESFAEEILAE